MIECWFPVATYKKEFETLKLKNSEYIKRIYEIKKNITPNTHWMCDTFSSLNTSYKIKDDDVFSELIYEATHHVTEFGKAYGIKSSKTVLDDCWFNIAPPGEYQEFHSHQNSHFALVYYVKAPENCGNIVFRSMVETTVHYVPNYDETNVLNLNIFDITPKEGLMIIFPAHLQHMVKKNKSKQDRISIAMNFSFVK